MAHIVLNFKDPLSCCSAGMKRKLVGLYLLTKYCKIRKIVPLELPLLYAIGLSKDHTPEEKRDWQNVINRLIKQLKDDLFIDIEKQRVDVIIDGAQQRTSRYIIKSFGIINQSALDSLFEEQTPDFERELQTVFVPIRYVAK